VSRRRFAEGTTVAPEKTKGEIERLVQANDGKQFFVGWADERTAVIGFRAEDRIVRLHLPLPDDGRESETRRRWRCQRGPVDCSCHRHERGAGDRPNACRRC